MPAESCWSNYVTTSKEVTKPFVTYIKPPQGRLISWLTVRKLGNNILHHGTHSNSSTKIQPLISGFEYHGRNVFLSIIVTPEGKAWASFQIVSTTDTNVEEITYGNMISFTGTGISFTSIRMQPFLWQFSKVVIWTLWH